MATNPKLPDPKAFTREELAERWKRWNCDISCIGRYIDYGQLKEGFSTFRKGYNYLRDLRFIVCLDNQSIFELIKEVRGLKTVDEKGFNEFKNSRTISCPDYLYMSLSDPKDVVDQKTYHLFGKMIEREDSDEWISYVRDLENNTLFPVRETFFGFQFAFIKKPKLEDLVIPLEEVLRFEKEHGIGENKQDLPDGRQEKIAEKEQEDADKLPQRTAYGNKPPPARKTLTKKEVAKRIGISVSHLENVRKQEDFPKSFSITGGRLIGWDEDEIEQWIEERKKQRGGPITTPKNQTNN